MKTILIDCHIFDQNFQGIRTFLKGIITELIALKKHNLILVSYNTIELQNEFGTHKNVKYLKFKSKNKFKRLIIELPNIIKSSGSNYALFNYTAPIVKVKGCKYLTVLHDVLFLDFPQYFPLKYRVIHKLLFKLSILSSEHILTVSEYSRRRINFHFGLNLTSKYIIPNAVDKMFYKPIDKKLSLERLNNKYGFNEFVLYVSRVEPRKNHQLLIDWYLDNKIYLKNIQLVFVGKYAFNQDETKKMFDKIKLESNNMFYHLEQVSNSVLFDLNNAAKVAVFPSLCEGFGIPPLESGLLKTPTLCSNVSSLEDFDFFGDYHQDPRTTNFISKLNELVLSNSFNNYSFLNNCSDQIKKKYNWKNSTNYLSKIIHQ